MHYLTQQLGVDVKAEEIPCCQKKACHVCPALTMALCNLALIFAGVPRKTL